MAPQDVRTVIQADNIDILIDLSGHTLGNRLDVFALDPAPAPVMLTYIGYPNNTGIPSMRRISDKYTERYNKHKDNIICMNRPFLCFTPSAEMNLTDDDVKVHNDVAQQHITFGCFCKLPKITNNVIQAWKEILTLVPNSRFVLKSRYFEDETIKALWKMKFGALSNRVVLLKGPASSEMHMKMYKILDIHLDTFPYSGTTITSEALYMNVPVVTMAPKTEGSLHVSRVSGSFLDACGLSKECVADTPFNYIQKAVALAKTPLGDLNVRKRFKESPLMDYKNYVKELEKIFTDLV